MAIVNTGLFLKGQEPWNKGIEYVQVKGSKHPNWKGGLPKCLDCDKQLSRYGSLRCRNCFAKAESWKNNRGLMARGRPSPNKGKQMSEQQKMLISQNRKGKTAKENNPNWKGGTSSERHLAYSTPEYKNWRCQVFSRDNYTCQFCGQYGGVLHADHIERWSDNEGLRYSVDNGRTLCVPCHYYITFKRKMPIGARWCNYRMT